MIIVTTCSNTSISFIFVTTECIEGNPIIELVVEEDQIFRYIDYDRALYNVHQVANDLVMTSIIDTRNKAVEVRSHILLKSDFMMVNFNN